MAYTLVVLVSEDYEKWPDADHILKIKPTGHGDVIGCDLADSCSKLEQLGK